MGRESRVSGGGRRENPVWAAHGSPLWCIHAHDNVSPLPTPDTRLPTALRILVAMTALLACSAFAAADISLSAHVEPSEVVVGEPLRYVVTVTHPVEARAEMPALRGNTGRFEVEDFAASLDTGADGRVTATRALTLTAWTPGDDTLPPQRVEIRVGDDTAALVLYTQPTRVSVVATAPADAEEIADIRDRERLPRAFPWGIPLLLAAIAAILYFVRRRKNRPRPAAATKAREATPDEAALARLRQLETSALPSREFAFALSEIVRGYLAARFGVDALEATTSELMERVKPLPLAAEHEEWLLESCEALDRVKFADARIGVGEANRRIAEVRAFVRETTPVATDAPPGEGRPA